MPFVQSIEGCMEAAIGASGLTASALQSRLEKLEPALDGLKAAYQQDTLPLLRIAEQTADLDEAEAALSRLCAGAETLIFFGTGGSSLGGQMIAQLGGWCIPGQQPADQACRPRTRFYDNLDPRTLEGALAMLDMARTRFIVISKSGNTPETLVQFLTALQQAKAAGLEDQIPDLFLAVTEPAADGAANGLRAVAEAYAISILDHHPGIGGRYAALSSVGMLPAMARGLDAKAIRAGAAAMVRQLLEMSDAGAFSPAIGAAMSVAMAQDKGARVQVMMPYGDRLERFANWYVQLAAESLGKEGKGFTPVAALGPVDQHSSLQLYLDGPRDHLVTIVRERCAGAGPVIDTALAEQAGAAYLGGRCAGDLVAAQQRAIPQALSDAGQAVRTIDMERLDEATLGGLMMHFMLEVILSGHLLGVDPFDQPAVEAGKILTRRYLGAGA